MAQLEFRLTSARLAPEVYLISIVGELDLSRASELEQALAEAEATGATRVIVDLVGVTFIDSTALGILTGGAKAARAHRGELVLVSADPRATRVLEITGLHRVFRVEPALGSAVDRCLAEVGV